MQLAIAAGGAALGGVAGGLIPGVGVLLGVQLGFLGGAILGGILFPTEVDAGGPSRDDVRLSSAATGRFIPIPYGTVRIGGQYLWVDEPVFKSQTESKGGPEVKTTTMQLTWACGICEGPIAAVTRIWLDAELVFDISDGNPDGPALTQLLVSGDLPSGVVLTDTTQTVAVQQFGPIRIYLGADGQPPDPLIVNDPRIGEAFGAVAPETSADFVPPFQGLCYAVFDHIRGEAINNHFPQCEFEVLTAAGDIHQATEYEPVPARSREQRLKDLITFVSASNIADPIYRWNTIDRNPDDPEIWSFAPVTAQPGDDIIMPRNVGTWDDPDLLVLAQGGTGDSRWSTHHMLTGAEVSPRKNYAFVPGSQPIGGWWWPSTAAPTRFVGVGETSDKIFSFPIAWDDTIANMAEIAIALDQPPIPGTTIASASFEIKPGFVGPDGLLYITTGETNTSHQVIVALDPVTLDIVRVAEPYKTSPASSDPFWSDMMLTYDAVTDKIVIAADGYGLRRVDRATMTVDDVPDIQIGAAFSTGDNFQAMKNGPFAGILWLQTGAGNIYQDFDIWNMLPGPCGSISATGDYGVTVGTSNEIPVFDPVNGGIWINDFFNTDWLAFLPVCRKSPICPTAEEIAKDISDRCEVPAALRQTTLWANDIICGYLIGRRISGREALAPIAGAINGDFRTQDGVVQFIKLDTASIKTIPEDDLGAAETIDAKVPGRDIQWPYERELPARVDVQYVDRAMDYSSNTQGFDRPVEGFKGRKKETVQMPIVFDADSSPTPIQIAERLLYQFDANRRLHALAVTWKHLNLNVGDAFSYVRGPFTHTARVEKWALAENNKILIEAKDEDVSINTGSGGAGNSGSAVFQSPTLGAGLSTELFLIDSSLLRDQDDAVTGIPLYAAVAPAGTAGWPGANLLRSDDAGATWKIVASFGADQAVDWGIAASALPTARLGVVDRVNTLTVNMRRGVLTSASESDLDEDRSLNALLVGRPGRWEVVRFATAVDQSGSPAASGDTFALSNLRRGQRGTDVNTGNHAAGDTVIVLEAAKIVRVHLDAGELNVERSYKAVTLGVDQAFVAARSFTLAGETRKPYALLQAAGTRDSGTGNWTVTDVRRTRVGGGWIDFVEPPLGEESADFELDVLTGAGGAVALTKTDLATPSVVLTQAELIAAGLGVASPEVSPTSLTVRWHQVSAVIGRGKSVERTLTSPTPGNP
ncbi:MAG TPA: phage tail protein [Kiloniellales bacterium]